MPPTGIRSAPERPQGGAKFGCPRSVPYSPLMSHSDLPEACYLPVGELGPRGGEQFDSTRLSAAPWYPDGQHGGAVAGLMARAVEQQATLTSMEVARVTIELFRAIPVTRLEVVTDVVREGKKIQTSSVSVFAGDVEMARGLVQRLRVTDLARDFQNPPPPTPPEELDPQSFGDVMFFPDDGLVSFGRDAVEVAQASGSFVDLGPKTVWFRIIVPLVAGEALSPLQRAVMSGDFSNGLTRHAQPFEVMFMNSDLTVRLARYPQGEWIALAGDALWDRGGRGTAQTTMFDIGGAFGTAGQTLFLEKVSD